jgi:hypothetical protein
MAHGIEDFQAAARGMIVSHVWRGYGSALFLEFGELTPSYRRDGSIGQPTGELELAIEWSWRIEDERSILCGSWSEEELWRPTFDRLVGREVVGLSLFGRLPEVLASLSGPLYVASFMTAEGDPEWTLFDRRTPEVVSLTCRSGLLCLERSPPERTSPGSIA